MLTNRAALGALAVVGVVAAGTGAYIANRQNPVPATPQALTQDVNLPSGPGAVTETENSVSPAPAPIHAPAAPEAVKRNSGSAVRLPTTVMMVSPAMCPSPTWRRDG